MWTKFDPQIYLLLRVNRQEELLEVDSALESENSQLQQQRAQLERIAISITAQMVVESQVVLLFINTDVHFTVGIKLYC